MYQYIKISQIHKFTTHKPQIMTKITIQVLSDMHLEFYKNFPKIKPLAPYLFLAGDIGTINSIHNSTLEKFISYCSTNWIKIFYVLGNHEFYQTSNQSSKKKTFQELCEIYKNICNRYPNVVLLNNTFCEIVPGLNVYGTTLWTGEYGFEHEHSVNCVLNDYNMIVMNSDIPNTKSNIPITEKFINNLSTSQFDLLKKYLNSLTQPHTNKTIVITHFPPFRNGSSNPIYSSQPIPIANYFSWSNAHTDLNCDGVVGWICGHTHWSFDLVNNGVRFISNQMGYKDECASGESGFVLSAVYDIEY